MDDTHVQKILNNIQILKKHTTYKSLMELCINYDILTENMKENIEKKSLNEEDRHEMLFEKITHRGPKAFGRLLKICQENFKYAYGTLSLNENQNESYYGTNWTSIKNSRPTITASLPNASETVKVIKPTLVPYEKNTSVNVEVKHSKIFGNHKIDLYSMSSKVRGVLLLVNIIGDRKNAILEADYLISLFRGLGFIIFYYEDLPMDQLDQKIKDLSVSDYINHADSFAFALLAKSTSKTRNFVEIFNSYRDIEYFIMKFNNKNCRRLINKPKLFIFPKYKLNNNYQSENDGGQNLSVSMQHNISTYSDILYFFLEYDNEKKSFLDYISSMCEIWSKNANKLHVQEILKLVNSKTFKTAQENHRDTVEYGFTNIMFFNPGIYKEENILKKIY